jgi:hypothetical protein
MANASSIFYTLMLMQIFFSLGVTMIVAVLPAAQANQIVIFTNSNNLINVATLSTSMVGGVGSQQTIPLIEFGALIFYSTNIFINLVVNFFFAVPQMIIAFVSVLFFFIPISYTLQLIIKTTGIAVVTIVYYYLLLIYIMGLRAPQGGVAR